MTTMNAIHAQRAVHQAITDLTGEDGRLWTEVLIASGTQRVPAGALADLAAHQRKVMTLLTDQKLSNEHKLEQMQALDDAHDTALLVREEQDVQEALKAIGQEEGEIRAQLKGTHEAHDPARQARAQTDATIKSNYLTLAQAINSIPMLANLYDEIAATDRAEWRHHVGAVIVERVATLALGTSDETQRDFATRVMGEHDHWMKANPSPAARLRAMPELRENTKHRIREQYRTLREKGRFRR